MAKYQFDTIESLDAFETFRASWNDLLKKSSSDSIFLTWEWLYTWAEYYVGKGRELFIITVSDDGELIGIAPWYINSVRCGPLKMRRVEFLGLPETTSDYLDVIAKKGFEGNVASSLYDYLANEIPTLWDGLSLRGIHSGSSLLREFLIEFRRREKFVEVSQGTICPILKLPRSSEDLFASLSANRRQQFRRHHKILCKKGEVRHLVRSDSNSLSLLDDLFGLYEKRWKKEDRKFYLFLKNFISRSEGKYWVQIDMLNFDGKNIAGILHLNYENTMYYYLVGVDTGFNKKISIGNVLVGLCLQNAVEKKLSSYDFLAGGQNYKFHWANHMENLHNFLYYQKKAGPVMLYSIECIKRIGKILLR